MELTAQQLVEIFAKLRTLTELGVYFQLTDKQLQHPGCAEYLIQRFKNNEQPIRILKEKMSTKDFPQDPPFPDSLDQPQG
ncbi:MAG: hypothetical protein M3Q73_04370 [bacterium]|nr:hypothetical protein [bacterium]